MGFPGPLSAVPDAKRRDCSQNVFLRRPTHGTPGRGRSACAFPSRELRLEQSQGEPRWTARARRSGSPGSHCCSRAGAWQSMCVKTPAGAGSTVGCVI